MDAFKYQARVAYGHKHVRIHFGGGGVGGCVQGINSYSEGGGCPIFIKLSNWVWYVWIFREEGGIQPRPSSRSVHDKLVDKQQSPRTMEFFIHTYIILHIYINNINSLLVKQNQSNSINIVDEGTHLFYIVCLFCRFKMYSILFSFRLGFFFSLYLWNIIHICI